MKRTNTLPVFNQCTSVWRGSVWCAQRALIKLTTFITVFRVWFSLHRGVCLPLWCRFSLQGFIFSSANFSLQMTCSDLLLSIASLMLGHFSISSLFLLCTCVLQDQEIYLACSASLALWILLVFTSTHSLILDLKKKVYFFIFSK